MENSPAVNKLLFLLLISYFIVGADLGKEIAKDRDEIGFITAVIEESIHTDNSDILSLLECAPKVSENIPIESYQLHYSDFELFPPARSPPSA